MLRFTQHAEQRMAKRNLSTRDVDRILSHGSRLNRAGVVHVHLRDCDVPKKKRTHKEWQRLRGATIVMNRAESTIITVWRNRQRGYRHIRCKPRYCYS